MKFWNFDDTDSAIVSLSSISALSFGIPYLVAPEKAKNIACEKSIVSDPTVTRFMGHGLTTTGIVCASCNNLSPSDRKDALKVLSAVHVSVAGMIAHATYQEEMKNPIGIANVLLHSGLAMACAARGFRKDDDDGCMIRVWYDSHGRVHVEDSLVDNLEAVSDQCPMPGKDTYNTLMGLPRSSTRICSQFSYFQTQRYEIMAEALHNNNNLVVPATRGESHEIHQHVGKKARWLNHPALQGDSKPKTNYQLSELQRERLRHKVDIPNILKVPHALVDGEERDCNNQGDILGLFPRLSSNKGSLRLCHLSPLDDFDGVIGSGRSMRVGIVLSGGQAAGGHNVIIGLFRYLKHRHPGSTLLGFLNGPKGIVKNISKVLEAEELGEYRNLGGFHLLGSGRDKIETPEDLAAAAETCRTLQLDGLVVIGGDDSNTNAAVLAEYFLAHDVGTKVVGVPKTLDGDLKSRDVPISFGFDTACKVYSEIIGNIMVDALSAKKYWHFIRLMGRAASHVTLEAALQTHPQIAFISEEISAKHVSLGDVARIVADCVEQRASIGKNYGVVLLPEGLVEFVHDISTLITEINNLLANGASPENIPEIEAALSPGSRKAFTSMSLGFQKSFLEERDPHGNVQVAHIECEKLLIRMVENELEERKQKGTYIGKFSGIPHYLGYEGRCSLPTNFDSTYCHALGAAAGALLGAGKTGIMAAISDLHLPTTQWRVGGVPLVTMMNMELRKGKEKSVIKKALVDLDGEPMNAFKALRKNWMLQDCYRSPGPIQFKGHEWADVATITLSLELNEGKPILLKDTENTMQFN